MGKTSKEWKTNDISLYKGIFFISIVIFKTLLKYIKSLILSFLFIELWPFIFWEWFEKCL